MILLKIAGNYWQSWGTGIDFVFEIPLATKYDFVMKALFRQSNQELVIKLFWRIWKRTAYHQGIADARVDDLAYSMTSETKSVNDSLRTINAIGAKACYVLVLSYWKNIFEKYAQRDQVPPGFLFLLWFGLPPTDWKNFGLRKPGRANKWGKKQAGPAEVDKMAWPMPSGPCDEKMTEV